MSEHRPHILRAGAALDVSHVRLGTLVDFLEACPDQAYGEEALFLLRAAFSPMPLARPAPQSAPEPEAAPEEPEQPSGEQTEGGAGGEGGETLAGASGSDSLGAGEGSDSLTGDAQGAETLVAGDGNDALTPATDADVPATGKRGK